MFSTLSLLRLMSKKWRLWLTPFFFAGPDNGAGYVQYHLPESKWGKQRL